MVESPKNSILMTGSESSQLPGFIKNEQEKRRQEKKLMFDAVQKMTEKGKHLEALDLWNQMTSMDRAA